jgi:DNA-binding SARP family transcriptional activator
VVLEVRPRVTVDARRSRPDAVTSQETCLTLLDGFELTQGGRSVSLPLAVQRALAFLALHGRPLLRLYVAGVLWPDTPEERAGANLRSTLWRLHQPAGRLVEATGQHLRLAATVQVDVHDMSILATRLLDSCSAWEHTEYRRLFASGELLRDWYDDWVMIERERFRQLRLHALEKLCEYLTAVQRFGDAVQAGMAAVAAEPLRESAQRVLIRAHLAEGNDGEAIRQFRSYAQNLHAELGLAPSARIRELVHIRP